MGRRYLFLLGTLYMYRCITMYVTTLPVPGMHMVCAPKVNNFKSISILDKKRHLFFLICNMRVYGTVIITAHSCFNIHFVVFTYFCMFSHHLSPVIQLYGDSEAKLQRVLQLLSGGGLSINGSHLLCGDFLYSGHTVILTLTYLFIKECMSHAWTNKPTSFAIKHCHFAAFGSVIVILLWSIDLLFFTDSPRSFWWYHLLCWLMAAVGVVCILVAHEHYTVDVVVAYFITTRLFYWYHTMANLQVDVILKSTLK